MSFICLLLSVFVMVFAKDDGLTGRKSTIPVLDLQKYYNEETKEEFLDEVRDALHKVGFFAIKNSGVNQEVLNNLYGSLETFFAFDRDTKMKVSAAFCCAQRGYTGFGDTETAKGSSACDIKEFYMMGRTVSADDHKRYNLLVNQWPEFMDFEKPAVAFYNHLEEYSELFQEIFSLALYQEKDFLHKICKNGDTSCRMIHYPNIETKEKIWAGAHTDIDLFTILPRATKEGLEVMDDQGKWHPVFIKEDAMIINGGDFLEAFSNGYFKSSMHRVKRPKKMDSDRYSCVHFVHPRSEARIYPIGEWVKKTGGLQKYTVATRWELLMERLADMGTCTDSMLKELGECRLMERLMEVGRESKDAMQRIVKAGYGSDEVKQRLVELDN
ncbi:MAG: hypothetical protein S4CHLAM20_03750 [Chlamydiia bacterium]|nr:hypothetical protein [Chlamydiia bacterium]